MPLLTIEHEFLYTPTCSYLIQLPFENKWEIIINGNTGIIFIFSQNSLKLNNKKNWL